MISLEQRGQFINDTFRSLHAVCQHVYPAVPQVITYFNMFAQEARAFFPGVSVQGEISGNDYGPIYASAHTNPPQPLLFVPLYQEDAALGMYWRQLCEQNSSACYCQQGHMLVDYPERLDTPTKHAFAVLHELFHAYRAVCERRAGQPRIGGHMSDTALDEESAAHLFEGQLMRAFNPQAFQRALENQIWWLEQNIWPHRRGVGCPILVNPNQSTELDAIFGPTVEQRFRNTRHSHFAMVVYMYAFARWLPPDEAAAARRDFLRRFYIQLGFG
jgi:hypothetical protein